MTTRYDALLGDFALLSTVTLGLLTAVCYRHSDRNERSPVRMRLVQKRPRGKHRAG